MITSALMCLSLNIYYEARSENSINAQAAVAQVVMNRVESPRFPNDVCAVVQQQKGNTCQFSWYCDGKSDIPRNQYSFLIAQIVAFNVLRGDYKGITGGATHYHANYVNPYWSGHLNKTVTLGTHIFYKEPSK